MMATPTRRRFVSLLAGLVAAPLVPPRATRAQTDPLLLLVHKVTGGAAVGAGRVTLDIPRLSDNGHAVPLKVSVESAMTAGDYVRSVTLLSERNPRPIIAKFYFGPHAGRAEVVTRVRLNGSQRVLALAQFADGSYWSGSAEVEVTESACLDAA